MSTHALEELSIQRECRLNRCHRGCWRSWGQSLGYLLLECSTAGGFLGQASGRHPRVTGGLLPERGRGTLGLPEAAGRTHGHSQWQSPGLGGFRRGRTQGLVPPCLGELSLPSLCSFVPGLVLRQVYATSTASHGEGESPSRRHIAPLRRPFLAE